MGGLGEAEREEGGFRGGGGDIRGFGGVAGKGRWDLGEMWGKRAGGLGEVG